MNGLPVEVVEQVLLWLEPLQVFTLRRLSRVFCELISRASFVRENVLRVVSCSPERGAVGVGVAAAAEESASMSRLDAQFLSGPTWVSRVYWGACHFETRVVDWASLRPPLKPPPPPHFLAAFADAPNLSRLQLRHFSAENLDLELLALLTHLKLLAINNCQLTGNIPAHALAKMEDIQEIDFNFNKLEGRIPESIADCKNLVKLFLAVNNLSGPIPSALGRLSNLQVLSLNHNNLEGSVPPELGQLSHLTVLYLKHNRLSGPVPRELTRLKKLTTCDMSGNKGLTCSFDFPVLLIDSQINLNCVLQ